MEIHYHRPAVVFGKDALDAGKRGFIHIHKELSGEIDDERLKAPLLKPEAAAAGRVGVIVGGADYPYFAVKLAGDVAVPPDVIAGGYDVGAAAEDIGGGIAADADVFAGVLSVDDREVGRTPSFEFGQGGAQLFTAAAADHVSEREHTHGKFSFSFEINSRSRRNLFYNYTRKILIYKQQKSGKSRFLRILRRKIPQRRFS